MIHRSQPGAQHFLYERVAAEIGELIERGTYRPGDRIPSIRELAGQRRISINTALGAYARLEDLHLVEVRPQSGYYVASRLAEPAQGLDEDAARKDLRPRTVSLGRAPLEVMRFLRDPALLPLGRALPNLDLLPADRLARMLASEARRFRNESVAYAGSQGLKRLRTQIAQRAVAAGCRLGPDDVIVTSGCVEAVTLALQATCKPGDTVAVASPVYSTFLNSIQWLGLKVLEIPSRARKGMSLSVLEYALRHQRVDACLSITNFSNPLGSVMTDGDRKQLVEMLARREIPLIEDDVYGELGFGPARPFSLKALDQKGLVLECSSFSKTLAPGYRVGWIVPGRYRERVEHTKALFNVATASPTQLAIAEFLGSGGYDRHLRTIRRTYARQVAEMRASIGRWFPDETRVSRPEGGFVLWVEMPPHADGFAVYEQALRRGIGVAPGCLFTIGDGFRNCLRLSAAVWSSRIAEAVRTLGLIAHDMVEHVPRPRAPSSRKAGD